MKKALLAATVLIAALIGSATLKAESPAQSQSQQVVASQPATNGYSVVLVEQPVVNESATPPAAPEPQAEPSPEASPSDPAPAAPVTLANYQPRVDGERTYCDLTYSDGSIESRLWQSKNPEGMIIVGACDASLMAP